MSIELKPIHLVVEGILDTTPTILDVGKFLAGLPMQIGMTPIAPRYVHKGDDSNTLVGFQIIAESHISVHVKENAIFVDVFSCKPFNTQIALAYLRECFSLECIHYYMLDRLTGVKS